MLKFLAFSSSCKTFCGSPNIVRSLSVSVVTGRIQVPIFACTLFSMEELNLVTDSSKIFPLAHQNRVKNLVNLHKFKMV